MTHCDEQSHGKLKHCKDGTTKIGSYQIEKCLGIGGMGMVFLGRNLNLDRFEVMKFIKPEYVEDARFVSRFEREARATAKLQHRNVVRIYNCGKTEDGEFFMVMEYVEGKNLQEYIEEYIESNKRLDVLDVVTIAGHIANGIAAIHSVGVIHRDLKPLNILLTQDYTGRPQAMVTDFGLAKPADVSPDSFQTEYGAIVGTPAYIPPEQWESSSNVTEKSDIYSFGVTVFQMIAGRVPFQGSKVEEIKNAHLYISPPDLKSVRPDIPDSLAELVNKTLAKKPDERSRSAEEIVKELRAIYREIVRTKTLGMKPSSEKERDRKIPLSPKSIQKAKAEQSVQILTRQNTNKENGKGLNPAPQISQEDTILDSQVTLTVKTPESLNKVIRDKRNNEPIARHTICIHDLVVHHAGRDG